MFIGSREKDTNHRDTEKGKRSHMNTGNFDKIEQPCGAAFISVHRLSGVLRVLRAFAVRIALPSGG
jgi:hypothetical protein